MGSRSATTIVLLLCLALALGDDEKPCTIADVSFFRSLSCKDGMIGQGPDCVCSQQVGCRLNGLRAYLPERSMVNDAYYNKQEYKCNRMFRLALSKYLVTTKRVTKRNGYPQDCKKANECHRPSLGKYIRYNSLMQFHAYKGLGANDTFIDFQYPFGFRWAASVPACAAVGKDNSWDCGLLPFSQALQEQASSSDSIVERGGAQGESTKQFLESTMSLVDLLRREKKNHVVQVMLYARMLNLVTRPGAVLQKYVAENTVTLNPHVALNYFKEQYKDNFTLHDTNSHGLGTFHRPPPTVSMHVRQGDSCDKVLDHLAGDLTNYLTKTASGAVERPCFSVDVYMTALHALREKYGILRVFLSTDSQEMLKRVQKEPSFTWVFTNSSRAMFSGRSPAAMGNQRYIDYLPDSDNQEVLLGGLADLVLMSRGDIFLGAFSSHMSKLAYYAMVGHHLRILPFHSLDYSLDCDTVDSCTKEDINRRNLTLEALAMWAPECIHGAIDWSPPKDKDPCGVYL